MQSWSEHRFVLTDTDHPSVCAHPTSRRPCVTFYCRGDATHGPGFNLELSRAHVSDVQHLLAALESLPPLPSESDDDPF